MIREVMEAKYKADKTIVLGLLWMYFHDFFVQVYEWKFCPQHILKIDALAR